MNAVRKELETAYAHPESIGPDVMFHSVAKRQGVYLAKLIDRFRPETVLELGMGYGASALWMQSANHPPARHIIVDPLLPVASRKSRLYRLLAGRSGVTINTTLTSQEYLTGMRRRKQTADLVFLDASEWFDSVVTDLHFITRILSVGGIVIVRNLWNPAVRKAVMFYLRNLPYSVVDMPRWVLRIVRTVPVVGELLLRLHTRRMDFCVLTLVAADDRPWKHYNHF